MKRFLLWIVLPVVLIAWGQSAFYSVDFAEYAYVTRFGKPIDTFDGQSDAGLHFKLPWPIDSVLRIDRRLQSFDLPAVEVLTRDPVTNAIDKTLAVDAFVTWRVPDALAADQFMRSVGTADQVKRILAPQMTGRLAATVSTMRFSELVSLADDAGIEARADDLQRRILATDEPSENLKEKLRSQYGIELISVRLRRLSYPETVRTNIYERIRSERGQKVAEAENEGRVAVAKILAEAEKSRRVIEADARAKKQEIEGQADVEADRIRNLAHAKDPEFYAFLQKLKAMQAVLADTRDVLLLSLNHELFQLLRESPGLKKDDKK